MRMEKLRTKNITFRQFFITMKKERFYEWNVEGFCCSFCAVAAFCGLSANSFSWLKIQKTVVSIVSMGLEVVRLKYIRNIVFHNKKFNLNHAKSLLKESFWHKYYEVRYLPMTGTSGAVLSKANWGKWGPIWHYVKPHRIPSPRSLPQAIWKGAWSVQPLSQALIDRTWGLRGPKPRLALELFAQL